MSNDLVDDPRITAIGLFSEAYTSLTGRLAGQIAEHGLALIEFEVLIRLSRSPEGQLRMTDLSTQTSLSTSGVTRVVDRLERDGLVRRTACPSDRRSSYTVITQAGRERLVGILPGHLDLIDQGFTGLLAPDQLSSLLAGLRVIRDALRPGATAGATAGANTAADAATGDAEDPAGAGVAR